MDQPIFHVCLAVSCIALAASSVSADAQDSRRPDKQTLEQVKAIAEMFKANAPVVEGGLAGDGTTAGATIDAGRGPIPVHVPASYDPSVPTPLIILLHGYTNTGQEVEDWMQFASLVDEYGFLYVYPTGTSDVLGNPFWNATNACCNLFGSSVNDSAYLLNVVNVMKANYNVDPRRVHFAGHSNGGFMAYRMACDHADVVASIASLAGATYLNAASCTPDEPVYTLQIHGTSDGVINYNGGCLLACYPSAVQTTEHWAGYDGCDITGVVQPDTLDLVADLPGNETQVLKYDTNCDPGGTTELWTMNSAPHSPQLSSSFSRLVVEFLLNHPKPAPCPTDVSGDGVVGIADLLAVIGAWGPCAGACPEDLSGDGNVGIADLLTVIGAWGGCG